MKSDTKRELRDKFHTMGMIGIISFVFSMLMLVVADLKLVTDENIMQLLQFSVLMGYLIYTMAMVAMSVLLYSTTIQALIEDALAKKDDDL